MSSKYCRFVLGEIWQHPAKFESTRSKELSRHFSYYPKRRNLAIEVDGMNENEIQYAVATLVPSNFAWEGKLSAHAQITRTSRTNFWQKFENNNLGRK